MYSRQKKKANVAFVGHLNSGKSTLLGHFIYKLGGIDMRSLQKFEQESEKIGKGSYKYAWILDKTKEERERGLTIKPSNWMVHTSNYVLNMINLPGHCDLVKNFLWGAFEADVAILVISAIKSEFEEGIASNGQTREHLLMLFALGIKQVIVVVNKMDDKTVNYSETRFKEIRSELSKLMGVLGFNQNEVPFIPISGWKGENFYSAPTTMKWYKGETFLSSLESIQIPQRLTELPLRMPIIDVFKISGVGIVAVGKVESGSLDCTITTKVSHLQKAVKIRSIESFHQSLEKAVSGDYVGINVLDVEKNELKRGMVFGALNNDPPCLVSEFTAEVIIVNHPTKIKVGYTPVFYVHTANCACRLERIIQKCDPKNADESIEKSPLYIENAETAIVVLKPLKPLCVESFDQNPKLARFIIRDSKITIGYGIIKSTVKIDLKKKK
ncbi:elongation factor 1-alpha 1 [Anaeramoeba flamelloides]|uniref:Elongation factor 1-alpha 1 n=1 Tax=Anaeramoeba flamelloides TaxID=1746091 RepID=A0ABQ8XPW6_9EUKA|nr:elongation factor 1-alpha 1 [Anaeramoeba flamelloides]